MPRRPREDVAGAVHHIYARGNARQPVFLDDADRWSYLNLLGRVVGRQRWRCLAYCLMDNHVHLLVETPEPNLAVGMQRLHGVYAQTFNQRHGRVGHLFQGRYGSSRIEDDSHLWLAASYIARNPVDAGLVARAEHWSWSSHASVIARRPPHWLDVERLLSYFASHGGDPRARYLEHVATGQRAAQGSDPLSPRAARGQTP